MIPTFIAMAYVCKSKCKDNLYPRLYQSTFAINFIKIILGDLPCLFILSSMAENRSSAPDKKKAGETSSQIMFNSNIILP